jgi:ribose transport system permease protein
LAASLRYSIAKRCTFPVKREMAKSVSGEKAFPGWEERLRDLLRHNARDIGLPLAVLALVILFSALSPVFLTVQNFQNIGIAAAALAAVSFGQTFAILTAGLDLSVGATVALV